MTTGSEHENWTRASVAGGAVCAGLADLGIDAVWAEEAVPTVRGVDAAAAARGVSGAAAPEPVTPTVAITARTATNVRRAASISIR